jgi:ribosome biogenesis GTPase / thiamine phosphate phosphatase
MSPGTSGTAPARVIRVAGPTATVREQDRDTEARLPVDLEGGPPAAGDLVELRREDDDVVVSRLLPRRTDLRRGTARGARTIAANADLLLAVESVADPELRPRFLDRYLVAAELGGLEAAIVITKLDLEHDAQWLGEIVGEYEAVGYPVVLGVSRDPAFRAQILDLIDGRIAVLAGHSGVGKSTLTTELTGVERATAAVSRKARSGRHTTTDPRLIAIPEGGAVIDTAGVRAFFLPPLDQGDLERGFPEIAAASAGCRFRGCRHDGEAGCAVEGAVGPRRLDSYRRLLHGE